MSWGQTERGFSFVGNIPPSKSVLIRCLAATVYSSELNVAGDSACDDVTVMRRAIRDFQAGKNVLDCGEAGLVLRMMMALASRRPGQCLLKGSPRLLERPHQPLQKILRRLGVETTIQSEGIWIESNGWQDPKMELHVDIGVSSQFATAILSNAWGLDFPLTLELRGEGVSAGYLDISLKLARQFGMEVNQQSENELRIPAGQSIRGQRFEPELDFSSAFAVAALAAVAGEAEILNFAAQSDQPDRVFRLILSKMGVPVEIRENTLHVSRTRKLSPVEWNLRDCPDLFPVLGVLCSLAPGKSVLFGAPHLHHKESNRIERTADLIRKIGRHVEIRDDGLEIHGRSPSGISLVSEFDPGQDHRLVMAAAVAQWAGLPIRIRKPGVVAKSFPEFLEIAQLGMENSG